MSDANAYPERVWITEHSHGFEATPRQRDGAQEYIRADIARDAVCLVVTVAEGYGLDPAELLATLQSLRGAEEVMS